MKGDGMPRRVTITDEDLEWLRQNHASVTYQFAAEKLSICVDTLKRVLMREGLAHFPAAKYLPSRRSAPNKWTRPCISCGSTKSRPKYQYRCDRCTERLSASEDLASLRDDDIYY
jgi:hypothetical protein